MKSLMREPDYMLWDKVLDESEERRIRDWVAEKFGPQATCAIDAISDEEAAAIVRGFDMFAKAVDAMHEQEGA